MDQHTQSRRLAHPVMIRWAVLKEPRGEQKGGVESEVAQRQQRRSCLEAGVRFSAEEKEGLSRARRVLARSSSTG